MSDPEFRVDAKRFEYYAGTSFKDFLIVEALAAT